MSRYPHKTKSQRKIITIQEWANFCSLSRQTIYVYLREYAGKGNEYAPTDIYSILNFHLFLTRRRLTCNNANIMEHYIEA
jgi:hypothetical protein